MTIIIVLASGVFAHLIGVLACWFISEVACGRCSTRTLDRVVMAALGVCTGIPLYSLVFLDFLSVFTVLLIHAAVTAAYLLLASFGIGGNEVELFTLLLTVATLTALSFPAIKAVRERPHSIPSITETARPTLPG